jgi:tRNA(Leu) C34 or U34 (ribose-2'-O)-methylase TrmL
MLVKIGLHQAKDAANLANIKRSVSCYGGGEIYVTGKRMLTALDVERLPRPLRDRRYDNVPLGFVDDFEFSEDYIPVAIEIGGSQNLAYFQHPRKAFYIFGPEDGSLPPQILRKCHHHVMIPTLHCLNLAVTVSTVLYDRYAKAWTAMTS